MLHAVIMGPFNAIFFVSERPDANEWEVQEGVSLDIPFNYDTRPDGEEAPEQILCRSVSDSKHYKMFKYSRDIGRFTTRGISPDTSTPTTGMRSVPDDETSPGDRQKACVQYQHADAEVAQVLVPMDLFFPRDIRLKRGSRRPKYPDSRCLADPLLRWSRITTSSRMRLP
jgi:hypothetical protein